jgi:uncharacterized protein
LFLIFIFVCFPFWQVRAILPDSMMHPFIENNLSSIRSLMREHGMIKGYLFGSAIHGSFGENSDVDILVEVNDKIDPVESGGHLWDLQFGLEELLGRTVHLCTTRSIKNPYRIQEIKETMVSIYE